MKRLLGAVLTLLPFLVSTQAFSKELSLACVNADASANDSKVYEVIYAEDTEVVALRVSDRDASTVKLAHYAVVSVSDPTAEDYEAGKPQSWYVLKPEKFKLEATDDSEKNFEFTQKKPKLKLVCSVNEQVFSNPARTISN